MLTATDDVRLPVDPDAGVKFDGGKLRYDLIPHDALEQFVRVLTYGAEKYADRNWEKGMDWSRLYAAALRHLTAWWRGKSIDPESHLPHLAHALCCINFLLAYELRGMGGDDRPWPA